MKLYVYMSYTIDWVVFGKKMTTNEYHIEMKTQIDASSNLSTNSRHDQVE